MAEHNLKRSTENKVLGGLCGGLGEYFNIDPTIIRLIWVLTIFWIGIPAIIAYLVGLIIVSVSEQNTKAGDANTITEPKTTADEEKIHEEEKVVFIKEKAISSRTNLIWGWLIIGIGVMVLIESQGYLDRVKEYIFPMFLIAAGIWVLVKGFGHRQV